MERVRLRHRHRGPEHRRRARQVDHAEARGERAQGEHHAHHRRVGARRDRREPARRLPAQPALLRQEIAEGRVLPPEDGQRAIVRYAVSASERVRRDRQKRHRERLKCLFLFACFERVWSPRAFHGYLL